MKEVTTARRLEDGSVDMGFHQNRAADLRTEALAGFFRASREAVFNAVRGPFRGARPSRGGRG